MAVLPADIFTGGSLMTMVLFCGDVPRAYCCLLKYKGQPKDEQGLDPSACTLVMFSNVQTTAAAALCQVALTRMISQHTCH